MTDDEKPPTREELVRAREDLQNQLDVVRNPVSGRDRNPELEARLEAMVNDIDECLATMPPDTA